MEREIEIISNDATAAVSDNEGVFESRLTKAAQDEIVRDLLQVLNRLDRLGLLLAGAHLATVIAAIQNQSVADHIGTGLAGSQFATSPTC